MKPESNDSDSVSVTVCTTVSSLIQVIVVPDFPLTAIGAYDSVISGFQESFTIDTLSADIASCVEMLSPAEHLDAHFTGFIDSKSRNTEAVVRARDEKYFLGLRFKSTGTDNVLSDLARCEEFGRMMIEKLESAGRLD